MPDNLIDNPGFETGDASGWTLGGDTSDANGNNIGVDSDQYDVNSGNYGLYAGNAVTTTLSQAVTTVPGQTYVVGFYLDVYQADATTGFFSATFGGQTVTNLTDLPETDNNDDPFTFYSTSIVATDASSTLTFTFNDPPGFFGLDDVSVTPANAAPCYCRGTSILTGHGEVSVEDLSVGDWLMTASGDLRAIKWIGKRCYAGRFANMHADVLPICFKRGSLGKGIPRRDLWVSPKHAMFIEGVLIPAERLVNGVSVVAAARVDRVEYFHIELDTHDVIVAEGALSESFVDDHSRSMFQNARDFAALYPDAEPVDAIYCAPRVEDGFVLEAVRRMLGKTAGIKMPGPVDLGPLRGGVDQVVDGVVRGWAQNVRSPDVPVCLDILVDGVVVVQAFAETYRADLVRAGIGDGRHGFEVALPATLTGVGPGAISIKRSADREGVTSALSRQAA